MSDNLQDLKKCPMCAENIKSEALKCRYCSHMFKSGILNSRWMPVLIILIIYFGFTFFIKETVVAPRFKEFDSKTSGVVVEAEELIQRRPEIKILGTLKNTGADKWTGISVEAVFYNKEGKVVDILTDFLSGVLLPGENLDFFIKSGSCSKFPETVKFESYKVRVKDARIPFEF